MSCEVYDKDYLEFYDPDKCIGDLGEKWCKFKWRIYNLQLNPKERFQSPVFTTRLLPKTYWYLEIRLPSPGNLSTMEISLHRLQNYENAVSIIDVIYKVICHEETQISGKETVIYSDEPPWGDGMSFTASFYKSRKNYLTVECRIRPNKNITCGVQHRNLDKTLPIHLRKLLQSGEFYDAIIKIENQELKVHRSILYARLPQLIEKYLEFSTDGRYIFKINDLPVSVVKEMLKYAYTGQAYVDLESVSISKDLLAQYSQNFLQSCCWDDHPFAQTSFNYETDSLSWDLKDVFIKSNLGCKKIDLLRIYPGKEMPKPTMISCNYFLVNTINNQTHELGETETLLSSNITTAKVKTCSFLEVKEGMGILHAKNDSLTLKTDFKFCYGSSKSSIENLYDGQFDLSQCTGCPLLSADMEALFRSSYYSNITVESEDGRQFFVHKEILAARWPASVKLNLKENKRVVIKGSKGQSLHNILLQLYKGTSSV
ncbi:hypothetical protein HNY73_013946 [Argiope bruennichi]|uniref:BTB domain-containing protein n=1 Tax=Argiope bruennichi TaxID=94029 RepID=A0A8T0ERF0_ARGBR|nr:hypothetical protein HNY73_013946 [Argiope bruennichi]